MQNIVNGAIHLFSIFFIFLFLFPFFPFILKNLWFWNFKSSHQVVRWVHQQNTFLLDSYLWYFFVLDTTFQACNNLTVSSAKHAKVCQSVPKSTKCAKVPKSTKCAKVPKSTKCAKVPKSTKWRFLHSTTMRSTSAAKRSSVLSLLEQGYSYCQIHNKTSISLGTISKIGKKVNANKKKRTVLVAVPPSSLLMTSSHYPTDQLWEAWQCCRLQISLIPLLHTLSILMIC